MTSLLTVCSPSRTRKRCFISLAAFWGGEEWSESAVCHPEHTDSRCEQNMYIKHAYSLAHPLTLFVNVTTIRSSARMPHSLTRYATLLVKTRVLPGDANERSRNGDDDDRIPSVSAAGLEASLASP